MGAYCTLDFKEFECLGIVFIGWCQERRESLKHSVARDSLWTCTFFHRLIHSAQLIHLIVVPLLMFQLTINL